MANLAKKETGIQLVDYKVGFCFYQPGTSRPLYKIVNIEQQEGGHVAIHLYNEFYGDSTIKTSEDSFKRYHYLATSYDAIMSDVNRAASGEFDLGAFMQDQDQESGLMSFTKEVYERFRTDLEQKQFYLEALAAQTREIVESRLSKIREIASAVKDKVKKLERIIFTIEIYLGIEEEIHQIGHGENAPQEEPIRLLQNRLYMDEEVGDPTNDGISIENLEDFDEWLMDKSDFFGCFNYEFIVPYPKCVRIMRVRREKKDRHQVKSPWVKMSLDAGDMETYLVIRNGQNIYCISSKMYFGQKLFPGKTELADLYEEHVKEQARYIKTEEARQAKIDKEMDKVVEPYKRNLMVIQGLIDRTEVFGQLFGVVNLLDGSAQDQGQVLFMYHNESQLGDGSITPMEWYNQARKYEEGDWIYYKKEWVKREDRDWYYFKLFKWNDNYPDVPASGIYQVFKDKESDVHYIKVYPEIWDEHAEGHYRGGYRKSKRSNAWRLESHHVTCNLNRVSHRHADFIWSLMHDRRQRFAYLKTADVLMAVHRIKKDEHTEEQAFAELIVAQSGVSKELAHDLIFWWKAKNKWKRALSSDDTKALRMILKIANRLENGKAAKTIKSVTTIAGEDREFLFERMQPHTEVRVGQLVTSVIFPSVADPKLTAVYKVESEDEFGNLKLSGFGWIAKTLCWATQYITEAKV